MTLDRCLSLSNTWHFVIYIEWEKMNFLNVWASDVYFLIVYFLKWMLASFEHVLRSQDYPVAPGSIVWIWIILNQCSPNHWITYHGSWRHFKEERGKFFFANNVYLFFTQVKERAIPSYLSVLFNKWVSVFIVQS